MGKLNGNLEKWIDVMKPTGCVKLMILFKFCVFWFQRYSYMTKIKDLKASSSSVQENQYYFDKWEAVPPRNHDGNLVDNKVFIHSAFHFIFACHLHCVTALGR